MTETEKRRDFLINTAYIAVILILYYLFVRYAFWLFFPFLFSFVVAAALQRPIRFLVRRMRFKKGLASFVCVLIPVLLFLLIGVFIGARLVTELRGLFRSLMAVAEDLPAFLEQVRLTLFNALHYVPEFARDYAETSLNDFFDGLNTQKGELPDLSLFFTPVNGIWTTAKRVPALIVAGVITIISCFFMTADYDRIVRFIKRQLPEDKRRAVAASKQVLFSSFGRLILAYILIMFITFGEMLVGLSIFSVFGLFEGRFVIGAAFLVALGDMLPLLGTGTILGSWGLYSMITGNAKFGLGLWGLYAINYIIHEIIEPRLVGKQLGLRPILSLAGIYIGLHLFGVVGLFIVPMSLMLVQTFNDQGVLRLWKPAPPAPTQQKMRKKHAQPAKK